MKTSISIIIPVYNIEDYLRECINSIPISNSMEIILVDDGSTDSSGTICDEYATKYKNITVIHQNNEGLSSARNTGIKKAKGEYLMFVDGDDKLNCKNLDIILKIKTDVVAYGWHYSYENPNIKERKFNYEINNDQKYIDKLKDLITSGQIPIAAWNKIVRRKIVVDNDIFFTKNIISEDIDWTLKLFLHINDIAFINEDIYAYRQNRSGSITNTKTQKTIDSLFYIIDKWYNYKYTDVKIKRIYYSYLAYWYIILLTGITKKEDKIKANKYKELLRYTDNIKVKKVINLKKVIGLPITLKILRIYKKIHKHGIV